MRRMENCILIQLVTCISVYKVLLTIFPSKPNILTQENILDKILNYENVAMSVGLVVHWT
jgi:hypothetical protein